MKRSKMLVSLIAVAVFCSSLTVPSFAKSVNEENNFNQIFEKAIVNNSKLGEESVYATLINTKTNSKYKLQLFKPLEKNSGDSSKKTQTYLFSTDKKYVTPYNTIQPDGEQTKSDWDGSISVKGYVTLEYNSYDTSKGHTVLLTNVNGGWDQEDITTYISDRSVTYACEDPVTYFSQHADQYPTSNSFSYNTGFSHAVLDSGLGTMCGADISCTLHHGTGSWILEINNNLFDNFHK